MTTAKNNWIEYFGSGIERSGKGNIHHNTFHFADPMLNASAPDHPDLSAEPPPPSYNDAVKM